MTACNTPVKEGIVVTTQSEKLTIIRKKIMELMLVNHPLDCPVCDAGGECDLQDNCYGLEVANILNDKAVPALAARLSSAPLGDESSQLAASILFKMQGPVANLALVAWMQKAEPSAAHVAQELATNGQSPEIWQAALDPAVPFRSDMPEKP